MTDISYFDGLDYGVGYDSLSQRIRGDSVIRTHPESSLGATGSTVDFALHLVESHQQLLDSLRISASVSLGNAITGGGSAQASFSNSHSIDEYSIYLLVTVFVRTAHQKMRDVRLNDEAEHYMATQGEEEFRKRYGDEFVIGVTSGGYYFGLVQIHCERQEDKTDISASLKASGGLGQWSASGDFNSAVSKISSQFDLDIYEHQEGGDDLGAAKAIGDMREKAQKFANSVQSGRQVPYMVELLDYNALPLPPGKNPIDVQHQQDVLAQLAAYRSQLFDLLGNVQYVLTHQDQFINPDVAALNDAGNKLSAAINAVYHAATTCFSDYHHCELLTDMSIPGIPVAERKRSILGTWQHVTDHVGTAQWTFSARGGKSYNAQEAGLGNARGIAILNGSHLQIDFVAAGGYAGRYQWDLDENLTSAVGKLEFFPPHTGVFNSRLIRLT